MDRWRIEYEPEFERFLLGLDTYEQSVLVAAIEHVLAIHGPDVCQTEWGKALGRGLYEFRIRRSLQAILSSAGEAVESLPARARQTVLIRVFFSVRKGRTVLALHGYDKARDSSAKRQEREIRRSRKIQGRRRR